MPSIDMAANNEERSRELETPEMTASKRRYKSELTAWYRKGHAEKNMPHGKTVKSRKGAEEESTCQGDTAQREGSTEDDVRANQKNRPRNQPKENGYNKIDIDEQNADKKTTTTLVAHTFWNLTEKVPQRHTTDNDAAKRNAIRTSVRTGQRTVRLPVMSRRRPSHS